MGVGWLGQREGGGATHPEWGRRVVVVVSRRQEALRDEAAGPKARLQQKHEGLEGDPCDQGCAEGRAGADPEHVLGAPEEVEGEREPRGAHADDVQGLQGLLHVLPYAMDDLWQPEAAGEATGLAGCCSLD